MLSALLNGGKNIEKIYASERKIYPFSPFLECTTNVIPKTISDYGYDYTKKWINDDQNEEFHS